MRPPIWIFVAMLLAAPASAQVSLDEIEASIGSRADELARVEALLADQDPNRRLAAMEALLGSGDPAFITKAKEIGLFSEDPRLRTAAIRAVLDAGGPFRAEFAIPEEDDGITDILGWLSRNSGSWSVDGTRGHYGFVVGPYVEETQCWTFMDRPTCAFRISGEEVMTGEWSAASAVLRLDETGALAGAFLVNGRGTPVTIRIPLIN